MNLKVLKNNLNCISKDNDKHYQQKWDRSFQTGLDVWPRVINNGPILIDDLYFEQYWIHGLEFGQGELNALV